MDQYLGQIQAFGFDFAPTGWAQCNGQLMSIAQNTALFALLGTNYGGDGIQTFALPDLRGRAAINQGLGAGLSSYVIGQNGGTETVSLLYNQMPVHTHLVNAVSSNSGATATASGNLPCTPAVVPNTTHVSPYSTVAGDTTMNNAMIGTAGGSVPHPNMQPYLAVNFCIALVGIFPSRG